MAFLALCSATGSPGTSTTALGLAMAWPRPVQLLEVALTGSSSVLAGYFRGQVPEPHDVLGFHNSSCAEQRERIEAWSLPVPKSNTRFLPMGHALDDARRGSDAWREVARTLRQIEREDEVDIIVDVGRLSGSPGPWEVLLEADQVLLVLSSNLPAVAGARKTAARLMERIEGQGRCGERRLGLCVVGPDEPFGKTEITAIMDVPVLGTVANDPVAAEVLSLGAPVGPGFARSPFNRSVHELVRQLQVPPPVQAGEHLEAQEASGPSLVSSQALAS